MDNLDCNSHIVMGALIGWPGGLSIRPALGHKKGMNRVTFVELYCVVLLPRRIPLGYRLLLAYSSLRHRCESKSYDYVSAASVLSNCYQVEGLNNILQRTMQ